MRKIAGLGFVAAALLPGLALAQVRQFRYYLSYGDQQLVDLARTSGADIHATLGAEIPNGNPVRVPAMQSFKVFLGVEHLDNGNGEAFVKHLRSFVAYDRARLSNAAFFSAPPTDNFSFRKISPTHTAADMLAQNVNDFGSGIVYDLHRNTIDEDNDGLPDRAVYADLVDRGVGAFVSGSDSSVQVRPMGTSHLLNPRYRLANGNFGFGWFRLAPGTRHLICTLSYENGLQVGESYGNATGETGLLLHTTDAEQTGSGNNLGFYRTSSLHPEPWQNIGAKYTLIGAAPVPEPGVMVGLLAGLGMLIRRRR
ncbi:MAG: PEP-CTERM sorting domain-containing protein [Chthonomonas sp.]|nr:PEP-CTERM sorting domain-containing protein [Chthonomonas sp.]